MVDLVALATHTPECSYRVWSSNGREERSDIVAQMVCWGEWFGEKYFQAGVWTCVLFLPKFACKIQLCVFCVQNWIAPAFSFAFMYMNWLNMALPVWKLAAYESSWTQIHWIFTSVYCKSRIFRMRFVFVYFKRGGFRTTIKCTRKVQSKSENPQRSATVRKLSAYEMFWIYSMFLLYQLCFMILKLFLFVRVLQ